MAESHPALGALVRPFPSVGSQMASKVGHPGELFFTFRAFVRPDPRMDDSVLPQTPHIIKPTAAVFANEWLLARVSAFVYRQTLQRRAVLATISAQVATVHANGFVDIHFEFRLILVAAMWSETPDSGKAFTTCGTANMSIFTHRG